MSDGIEEPLRRYQIMEPLGRGGSGRTFRAIDRVTSTDVAVKVLSLRDLEDWKRFDLFEREAAVLGTLSHPGIPRYIDRYASEATGDYFLVMELVEGEPLSRHIGQGKRLERGKLRDVLVQGLGILEYLHGLSPPVIHRDIKPANLLLDGQGRLHLVDFGGVRKAAKGEGNSTMIGSFGYMAPEQLHGVATAATDLYALGATIVALHAGVDASELPHDGLDFDFDAIELPSALAPVLRRMLEPNPKQRVQSVAEVRRLLAGMDAGVGAGAGPSRTMPTATTLPAPQPPTSVPATMGGVRALANVPAPLSVLVWILSALAAGGLTVMQVVILPLVFHIARRLNRKEGPEKRARLEGNLAEMEQTIASARRSFQYVAGQTHPIRDDDDANKPSKR